MRPTPIGYHELPQAVAVWRPTLVDDPLGGTSTTLAQTGEFRCKISQPSAAEQIEAQQAGTSLAMTIHFRPDADVRRGDELREVGDGRKFRVKWTIQPSEAVYLRADCERIQAEGER